MYPTPLRTVEKPGIFQKPTAKPWYYEDVFGTRNAEELDQGPADKCETDSDSNDALRAAFKRTLEYQRHYGPSSRKAQVKITETPTRTDVLSISSSSDEFDSDSEEETSDGAAVVIDLEDDVARKEYGFRIMPQLSSRRSVPQVQVKKLKARKFGLFSKEFGLSEDDIDDGTSTDEAMADVDDRETASNAPSRRRRKRQGRIDHPADRVPINQQLAELVAARARAEKAEKKKVQRLDKAAGKAAARAASLGRGSRRGAAKRLTRAVGTKSSMPAAHTKKLRSAFVVIDDSSNVDFSEYKRYA